MPPAAENHPACVVLKIIKALLWWAAPFSLEETPFSLEEDQDMVILVATIANHLRTVEEVAPAARPRDLPATGHVEMQQPNATTQWLLTRRSRCEPEEGKQVHRFARKAYHIFCN